MLSWHFQRIIEWKIKGLHMQVCHRSAVRESWSEWGEEGGGGGGGGGG